MADKSSLCPICGFLLAPGHQCPDLDALAKAAADAPLPKDYDVEIAKPYTIASGPYDDPDSGKRVTPDVIGEVIGWRVWQVLNPTDPKTIRLQSLGAGGPQNAAIWTPGKVMQAFCGKSHTPPAENCSCGFYAARTREHLLSMHYHSGFDYEDPKDCLVVGTVAMQGKIIPGTQGWRAQRVRPLTVLVLPSRWKVVEPLRKAYPKAEVKLENWLSQKKAEGGKKR
jgi:hypothetical protein